MEMGLTLLHQASIPTSYWTYAFATAVYLINRLPSPVIANMSPYAKLFHQPPNYLKLKVFGCLCFPWLRPYTSHKLDSRSLPCVFVGYSITQSAYLCLDAQSGCIYTSRHVQFVEDQFPFSTTTSHKATTPESPIPTPSTQPSFITIPFQSRSLVPAPPLSPPSSDSSPT